MTTQTRSLLAIIGIGLILVVGFMVTTTRFGSFLRTQVAPRDGEGEVTTTLRLTIPDNAPAGPQTFRIQVEDQQEQALLVESEEITVTVSEKGGSDSQEDDGSGSGDSGGGGGGGGSDAGDDQPSQAIEQRPSRTFAFAAEQNHLVSGADSGVIQQDSRSVVKLADKEAVLQREITAPTDNYWVYAELGCQGPPPCDAAVYLNGQAWKVVRLTKPWGIYKIGLLRNFSTGTVRWRFLNDAWEPEQNIDRNLLVDKWALSTDSRTTEIAVSPTTGERRSNGWTVLPHLNAVLRDVGVTPTVDLWQYYAQRLTVPPNDPAAIQSKEHLRTVIQYWQGINPARPRG